MSLMATIIITFIVVISALFFTTRLFVGFIKFMYEIAPMVIVAVLLGIGCWLASGFNENNIERSSDNANNSKPAEDQSGRGEYRR